MSQPTPAQSLLTEQQTEGRGMDAWWSYVLMLELIVFWWLGLLLGIL